MYVLETNVDDGTPEHLAFLLQLLRSHGAADAWMTPIVMKKGRAAHTLHCLCARDQKDEFLEIFFRHGTTLGVRISEIERAALPRTFVHVDYMHPLPTHKSAQATAAATATTRVPVKVGWLGDEVVSVKPEFDICQQIALQTGQPIQIISEKVTQQARVQLAVADRPKPQQEVVAAP